jgi:hypothetical protein
LLTWMTACLFGALGDAVLVDFGRAVEARFA